MASVPSLVEFDVSPVVGFVPENVPLVSAVLTTCLFFWLVLSPGKEPFTGCGSVHLNQLFYRSVLCQSISRVASK